MSLPYFPMYPTDFEAKTSHLTIAEDGAYNRLLRVCWMTPGCTIPVDEAWIMRRVRAHTDDDKATVKAMLGEFFDVEGGRYSNAKLMRIWLESNEAHERRKNAGSKGGKAKSAKTNNKASSNALAMAKQPEPEPEPIREEALASLPAAQKKASPTGSRLSQDWTLSKALGDWSLAEGATEQLIRSQAPRFKDYWIGVAGAKGRKADWDATWRNWIRKAIADSTKPTFKAINGGQNEQPTSKSEIKMGAFLSGARSTG